MRLFYFGFIPTVNTWSLKDPNLNSDMVQRILSSLWGLSSHFCQYRHKRLSKSLFNFFFSLPSIFQVESSIKLFKYLVLLYTLAFPPHIITDCLPQCCFTILSPYYFVPSVVRNLPMQKTLNPGSVPGSGRSPREGNGNPLQYSCLENPMDRGAWWATVHRVAKSQTQLSI